MDGMHFSMTLGGAAGLRSQFIKETLAGLSGLSSSYVPREMERLGD